MDKRYWPFEIPPVEQQTDQDKAEIRFLEAARRQGCRSYQVSTLALGADAANGRIGLIIRRGKSRWETSLSTHEKEVAAEFFNDFDAASTLVLAWLRE
jgi:hypothetical protein